jgi:uncharacterized protein (TIGR02147 family)
MERPNLDSNLDLNDGAALGGGQGDGGVPPKAPAATDITDYEDYRAYMRDRFAELQARTPLFSQRGLARKAGIANPGFFNEVIKGRRRLSPAAAAKMALGLELSTWEAEYFSALVEYAETREPVAKLKAQGRMLALKNRHLYKLLSEMPSLTETLREIMRELERDWDVLAAGLNIPHPLKERSPQEISKPALDPVSKSTLSGILEQLVCLRAKAEAGPEPQVVQFSLQMAPRVAGPST